MIINETYDSYRAKAYDPYNKEIKYLTTLDQKLVQGDTISFTLPISLASGITISFFSNVDYFVFNLIDSDITVSDVITINLTSEQTNKFIPGIVTCNVRLNGKSYSYLVGECFKGFFNQVSHY